jgi:hypothetical protein
MLRSCALLLATLAIIAVVAPEGGQAQADDASSPVAPALARAREASPGLPLDHAEVARLVGDHAVVRVYPQPGLTDPATVILRRQDGAWRVVAGPGTAFPDVAGLPEGLLGYDNPYTDDNARAVLGEIGIPPKRYERPEFGFQYPEAAEIDVARASVPTVIVGGPELRGPPFSGRSYEIIVAALGITPDRSLDQWGYDRMLAEIAEREAMNGPGGPNTQPLSATFFHTETNHIFQVDWFAGDSTIREMYVTTVGGGPVVRLTTRVYPVQNNPAVPSAEAAVTRIVQTLRAGPADGRQVAADRPAAYAGVAGTWARNGLGLTVDEQGMGRIGWRVYADAVIARQGEATIALESLIDGRAFGFVRSTSDPGMFPQEVPVMLVTLSDGLLLLTQGNTAHILCGAEFLSAPESLRSAFPCGYWR